MREHTAEDEPLQSAAEAPAETSDSAATGRTVAQDLVQRIVEAALFAATQPLTLLQLRSLFEEDQALPAHAVEKALDDLAQLNESRGVELVEVASGFRFQVRSEVQPWVAQLWAERQTRYSRALLETLALIAYRQPITRGEIEQIRGVAVSTHIIRTLEEREWVRVVGHRDVPGKPALFGTTRGFLDYFNLRSLDQLPPLGELAELPELEPELSFGPAAQPSGTELTDQIEPADDVDKSDVGEPDISESAAAISQPNSNNAAAERLDDGADGSKKPTVEVVETHDVKSTTDPTESDADASSEPHL